MTKQELLNWIDEQPGKAAYEDGGAGGTQCVELVSTYAGKIVGKDVRPNQCGDGKYCSTNLPKNFPDYFVKVDDLTDIQVGDVLSHWSTSSIQNGVNKYGHTSVVSKVTEKQYCIIEQWAGSKTIRTNTKSKSLKTPSNYAVIGIARPKLLIDGETTPEVKKDPETTQKVTTEVKNDHEITQNFKKGDRVKVKKGAKTYTGGGLAKFVYDVTYDVLQVGTKGKDDYIVIGFTQGNAVTAAIKADDLLKIGG